MNLGANLGRATADSPSTVIERSQHGHSTARPLPTIMSQHGHSTTAHSQRIYSTAIVSPAGRHGCRELGDVVVLVVCRVVPEDGNQARVQRRDFGHDHRVTSANQRPIPTGTTQSVTLLINVGWDVELRNGPRLKPKLPHWPSSRHGSAQQGSLWCWPLRQYCVLGPDGGGSGMSSDRKRQSQPSHSPVTVTAQLQSQSQTQHSHSHRRWIRHVIGSQAPITAQSHPSHSHSIVTVTVTDAAQS